MNFSIPQFSDYPELYTSGTRSTISNRRNMPSNKLTSKIKKQVRVLKTKTNKAHTFSKKKLTAAIIQTVILPASSLYNKKSSPPEFTVQEFERFKRGDPNKNSPAYDCFMEYIQRLDQIPTKYEYAKAYYQYYLVPYFEMEGYSVEKISIPMQDNINLAGVVLRPKIGASNGKAMILNNKNGSCMEHEMKDKNITKLLKDGFTLCFYNYAGVMDSEKRSESFEHLLEQATAACLTFQTKLENSSSYPAISKKSTAIYGYSLGGAIAAKIAAKLGYNVLVSDHSMSSIADFLNAKYTKYTKIAGWAARKFKLDLDAVQGTQQILNNDGIVIIYNNKDDQLFFGEGALQNKIVECGQGLIIRRTSSKHRRDDEGNIQKINPHLEGMLDGIVDDLNHAFATLERKDKSKECKLIEKNPDFNSKYFHQRDLSSFTKYIQLFDQNIVESDLLREPCIAKHFLRMASDANV